MNTVFVDIEISQFFFLIEEVLLSRNIFLRFLCQDNENDIKCLIEKWFRTKYPDVCVH